MAGDIRRFLTGGAAGAAAAGFSSSPSGGSGGGHGGGNAGAGHGGHSAPLGSVVGGSGENARSNPGGHLLTSKGHVRVLGSSSERASASPPTHGANANHVSLAAAEKTRKTTDNSQQGRNAQTPLTQINANILDTNMLTQEPRDLVTFQRRTPAPAPVSAAAVRADATDVEDVTPQPQTSQPQTNANANQPQPPSTARRQSLTQRLRQGYTPAREHATAAARPTPPNAADVLGLTPRTNQSLLVEELLESAAVPGKGDTRRHSHGYRQAAPGAGGSESAGGTRATLEKRRRSSSAWGVGRFSLGTKKKRANALHNLLDTVEGGLPAVATSMAEIAAADDKDVENAAPPINTIAPASTPGKTAHEAAAASVDPRATTPSHHLHHSTIAHAASDAPGLIWRRWTVETVNATNDELVLKCKPYAKTPALARFAHTTDHVQVTLRDSWADTPVTTGDVLHVLARRCEDGAYVVSDAMEEANDSTDDVNDSTLFPGGGVILHPDVLVSGTHVSNSLECIRRSVMERLVAERASNKSAVLGTLVHDMFQAKLERAFSQQTPSNMDMSALAEELVTMRHDDLVDVGVDPNAAKARLKESEPSVDHFMRTYVLRDGMRDASVELAPRGMGGDVAERSNVGVTELLDIEECVHAPRFGLKGRIDATVRATFDDSASHGCGAGAVIPLEVKTGKERGIPHRAQLLMYSLLTWERHGTPSSRALLWYSGGGVNGAGDLGALRGVRMLSREIIQLLQQRNRLANGWYRYAKDGMLPPLLGNPRSCETCFHRHACMKYHRALEGGDIRSCGAPSAFENTGALAITDSEASFLARWTRMVDAEESEARRAVESPWITHDEGGDISSSSSSSRLVNLQLIDEKHAQESGTACDGNFNYIFSGSCGGGSGGGDEESPFHGEGCQVVLGTMCGQYGVAMGRARHLDASGTTTELVLNQRLRAPISKSTHGHLLWRMDALEMLASFARMRASLLALTEPSQTALRRAVLYGAQDLSTTPLGASPRRASVAADKLCSGLNPEQSKAVEAGMAAHTYSCVIGRPGMGKTHAMAALAAEAWRRGKRVLIASHTNAAVDTVLIRLVKAGIPVVRLGQRGAVADGVRHRCVASAGEYSRERKGLRAQVAVSNIERANAVVGATCHGCHGPLIRGRRFDVCIADEAGQIATPLLLSALLLADKFVLVGDPAQLPPLCKSEVAKSGGYGRSLFVHLCESQPSCVVELREQFRMAPCISRFVSRQFYGGKLRDAASVQERASARPGSFLLDGRLKPVAFFDVPTAQESSTNRDTNVDEAAAIAQMLAKWCSCQPSKPKEPLAVLILTPYRAQMAVLRRALHRHRLVVVGGMAHAAETPPAKFEICTIDRAQGREADVVVLSTVVRRMKRGKDGVETIGHLSEPARACVALSRAKDALWVFGDRRCLQKCELWSKWLEEAACELSVSSL
ncbi:hypothetical protein PPROV_000700800 [Pycnococcus provasolii]|uniref:DNA replication ATP-dependent helicase/nuclease n=1 Tax=Pycnococcus provasolii TaxID=41880 RepID=A0A830HTK9_9CHLO|nr:hypothetical protein PPROV_000700800 [Pycnococcus provasolii]